MTVDQALSKAADLQRRMKAGEKLDLREIAQARAEVPKAQRREAREAKERAQREAKAQAERERKAALSEDEELAEIADDLGIDLSGVKGVSFEDGGKARRDAYERP